MAPFDVPMFSQGHKLVTEGIADVEVPATGVEAEIDVDDGGLVKFELTDEDVERALEDGLGIVGYLPEVDNEESKVKLLVDIIADEVLVLGVGPDMELLVADCAVVFEGIDDELIPDKVISVDRILSVELIRLVETLV